MVGGRRGIWFDGIRFGGIWFGGILYEPDKPSNKKTFIFSDRFGTPELVIVVYLRFGAWGKDASPLAAQMAAWA